MKLSDIRAWLASDRDYAQGAALYAALGTSKTYQRLFGLAATTYSRGVLARELEALVVEVQHAIAASEQVSPETAPLPVPAPAPEAPRPEQTSQLLVSLDLQLRQVRDERSHLHPQLTGKGVGKKARGVMAFRIVELTAQEARLKALKAHVRHHGRLPGPVATDEVSDAGELRRRLQNCLSQRSKLRKLPEQAAKLADIEAEIILIRSKLKL